jgi:hypothetical protein
MNTFQTIVSVLPQRDTQSKNAACDFPKTPDPISTHDVTARSPHSDDVAAHGGTGPCRAGGGRGHVTCREFHLTGRADNPRGDDVSN